MLILGGKPVISRAYLNKLLQPRSCRLKWRDKPPARAMWQWGGHAASRDSKMSTEKRCAGMAGQGWHDSPLHTFNSIVSIFDQVVVCSVLAAFSWKAKLEPNTSVQLWYTISVVLFRSVHEGFAGGHHIQKLGCLRRYWVVSGQRFREGVVMCFMWQQANWYNAKENSASLRQQR